MDSWKLGSVVELNSGGPPMVVECYRGGDESVQVAWVNEGKVERSWFRPVCLKPYVEQAAIVDDARERLMKSTGLYI